MRAAAKAALVAFGLAAPLSAFAQASVTRDQMPEAIDRCAYDILKKRSADTGVPFWSYAVEAIPGRTAVHIESGTDKAGVMFGRRVEYILVRVFNESKEVTYKDETRTLENPEFTGTDDAAMKAQAKELLEAIKNCRFMPKSPYPGRPCRSQG